MTSFEAWEDFDVHHWRLEMSAFDVRAMSGEALATLQFGLWLIEQALKGNVDAEYPGETVDGIRELAVIDRYYARDDMSDAGLPA